MSMPAFLTSVVGWLRAGYPEGIPENDYIPLVAVLARRLSHEEVHEVAAALAQAGDGPIGVVDIGMLITRVTNELPREEDVARVRSKLALGGWPLTDPRPAL